MLQGVDIVIDINYNIIEPAKSVIRTNAKKEAIKEIILNWLHDQIGARADSSKLNLKKEYRVKIGLDLNKGIFCTESDIGNKSLTCGLVRELLAYLDRLEILPLQS